jgi:uncharacterized protein YodC (DUF2158 family)
VPEQKLKVGQVVKLRSGSPKMTIEGYTGGQNDEVGCVWFLEGKLERGVALPGAEGFWAEVVTPKHRGLGASNAAAFEASSDGFMHEHAFGTTELRALDLLEVELLQKLGR